MSVLASIRSQLAPVHREGLPFIGVFAVVSLLLFWLWSPLGWLGTALTIWCTLFFRDPPRVIPVRDGLVVSPADGRISLVRNAVPPPNELTSYFRPCCFLNSGHSAFNRTKASASRQRRNGFVFRSSPIVELGRTP